MVYQYPMQINGNRVWRTYIGGKLLDEQSFNSCGEDSNFPEEWMFSTTKAINPGRQDIVEGLCTLTDEENTTLKSIIEKYPKQTLGEAHYKKFGSNTGVLIKLLDSAERLTVQVHPDDKKAKELFNSCFGKTESWHILSTRQENSEPAYIYLGFKPGITKEYWEKCFLLQDIASMLDCLNKLYVKAGETYLVCGGVPHAIGGGCFLIEVQQPTDYTIRTEKVTPSGQQINAFQCHQGLGFSKMFDCFKYDGYTQAEVREKWQMKPYCTANAQNIITYKETPHFQLIEMDLHEAAEFHAENQYYCVYVLSGEGTLTCKHKKIGLSKHTQMFVSVSCGDFTIEPTGSIKLLKIFGPQI